MEALVARLGRGADRLRHGEGDRQGDGASRTCAVEKTKAAVREGGRADRLRRRRRGHARGRERRHARGAARGEGYEVERRVVPDERDAIAAAIVELAEEAGARAHDRRHGPRAARRDARGDRVGARARRAGDRRGDPRRLDREDAARAALARRRRRPRQHARRQPARLAGRLPRRLRGAAAGARARARAARRREDRATARRDDDPPTLPATLRARSSRSSTRSSRCRSPTSARLLAVDGVPTAHDLLWITVAMVGARSLAMALNRLIDAGIDAREPAHGARELPAGLLTRRPRCSCSALRLARALPVAVCQLDPLVRWLWPIPVAGFVIYPYLKRFTWLCHLWLGAVDGLAPVGAWVAITGELPWEAWAARRRGRVLGRRLRPLLLAASTSRSTAREGLHSWATRFGERGVFIGARASPRADGAAARRRGRSASTSASLYWLGVVRRWRRCSSTSTRSCARATCAGSTPRSSR